MTINNKLVRRIGVALVTSSLVLNLTGCATVDENITQRSEPAWQRNIYHNSQYADPQKTESPAGKKVYRLP